jgi:hypothetical protein
MKIEIVDNFFDTNDFIKLNSLKLRNIESNTIDIYHNTINKTGEVTESCIDKEIIKDLHEKYHSKLLKILKNFDEKKAELYDYSDFTIIHTGKDYKFPIHDDTPNKLLSGVIYIKPWKNTGTIFYSNKQGLNKNVIDWKINRAVFFSRKERESWHSYQGDGLSNRVALVYNLMTHKIKDVYKIERKNYLYGQIRWKLNPYLFRYFKILI